MDAVLKSQCSPTDNASTKSENDEDMDSEDIVVSMTPPTSPKPPIISSVHSTSTVSRHSNSTVATTSALRDKSSVAAASASTSVSSSISATAVAAAAAAVAATASTSSSLSLNRPSSQDGPIDLSMKSTSSGGSSAKSSASPVNHHEHHHHRDFMGSDDESAAALSEEEFSMDNKQRPSSANTCDRPESRNDGKNTHIENPNGLTLRGTTPLDLTTKI